MVGVANGLLERGEGGEILKKGRPPGLLYVCYK